MTRIARAKLTGFDEIKKALEQVAPEVATKAGQVAIRKAAKTVADEIKSRVPVSSEDDRSPASGQYGHMRDNVKVRKGKPKKEHTVSSLVTMGDAFWWRFLEYGTVKQEAKPTIKPAFDAVQQDIVDNLATDLGKALDRAVKRYGGKR